MHTWIVIPDIDTGGDSVTTGGADMIVRAVLPHEALYLAYKNLTGYDPNDPEEYPLMPCFSQVERNSKAADNGVVWRLWKLPTVLPDHAIVPWGEEWHYSLDMKKRKSFSNLSIGTLA